MASFGSLIVLKSSAYMSSLKKFQKKKCKELISVGAERTQQAFLADIGVDRNDPSAMPGSFKTQFIRLAQICHRDEGC